MTKEHYFLCKDANNKEALYIEYENLKGYDVTPKNKLKTQDRINVTKMVMVSPSLTEKLIHKKIDLKIRYLLQQLNIIESSDDDSGTIHEALNEAERLKMIILNSYSKHLKAEYLELTMQKIQIIINELRVKLYLAREQKIEVIDDKEMGGKSR